MSAKKDLGEMIKLGLILVVYAVASCTVLAIVNNFTKPKIMQNQIEKANVAMKKVFANADDIEISMQISNKLTKTFFIKFPPLFYLCEPLKIDSQS